MLCWHHLLRWIFLSLAFTDKSVYTQVASIYANWSKQKKTFTWEKITTPRGFSWYTNMAAVLLFWNINMASVRSWGNALNRLHPSYPVHAFNPESYPHCSFKNQNPGFLSLNKAVRFFITFHRDNFFNYCILLYRL